ncbi:SDR family oxidoreductase [Pseudooceanicola sediminis]|uniref:SDR family oxidoreductase n=1 Tax=Pseudooceanicola sediminis TaxID=2211117 RepID=A0A399IYX4_9RHOB|nr:SDR family oxidoreductase [Pseudooceanicola sediminis]KAA2313331.1 SDR family oxidoreductase [Puniceibacterium sp. HSS470]RII38388.1 SDR family oxidoreductase [Pseudooceanicola sediminis]|tara:strand:- start:42459 stop:43337 length:879 start_codon:yes stop_codon:yes gene_type:complete
MNKVMISFGHGYSARAAARLLGPTGMQIHGTTRKPERLAQIRASGVTPHLFPGDAFGPLIAEASHLLISVAPDADGDPVLRELGDIIATHAERLQWVGYLSTTGVYGDHDGGWVDETTPLTPSTRRGQWRAQAEAAWQAIPGLPLHIFRLAGIYGPGRGPFSKVRAGTARRIIKPGQVFSRIHAEDIAQVIAASVARPDPGAIYNLCDDDPAPPQDVICHAAELLGLPLPPEEDFAAAEMTPMARSFYAESKRVRNDRIKHDLGIRLIYPTYRQGLAALLAQERGAENTSGN